METIRRYSYRLGGLFIEIEAPFDPLPQWAECAQEGEAQLHIHVRTGLPSPIAAEAERIDTSLGPVWREGNRFRMKDFQLEATEDFTHFEVQAWGQDVSHMVTMAFVLGARDNLLIHSSCVMLDGQGYAFIAPSGTGKSTHADNWVRAFPGCQLLNDDNPILSHDGEQVSLHGSPWSGKRPVYRQEQVPLRALVRIVRGQENRIEPASPLEALTMLLEATSTLRRDPQVFRPTLESIKCVVERIPCFILHCLPDTASARTCLEGIAQQNKY